MSAWIQRLRGHDEHSQRRDSPQELQVERRRPIKQDPKDTDPNVPEKRLQLQQKLLYERMLPGQAYVSAHINRLAHGFYENNGAIHESALSNVYFVSCHFVFHPADPRSHRIKRANIQVSIQGDLDPHTDISPRSSPRILKHAPELIYGAVSTARIHGHTSVLTLARCRLRTCSGTLVYPAL
jgi:hypothetical protein